MRAIIDDVIASLPLGVVDEKVLAIEQLSRLETTKFFKVIAELASLDSRLSPLKPIKIGFHKLRLTLYLLGLAQRYFKTIDFQNTCRAVQVK